MQAKTQISSHAAAAGSCKPNATGKQVCLFIYKPAHFPPLEKNINQSYNISNQKHI
jgi:hypothetical protein